MSVTLEATRERLVDALSGLQQQEEESRDGMLTLRVPRDGARAVPQHAGFDAEAESRGREDDAGGDRQTQQPGATPP